jgi:hypothetical protein
MTLSGLAADTTKKMMNHTLNALRRSWWTCAAWIVPLMSCLDS